MVSQEEEDSGMVLPDQRADSDAAETDEETKRMVHVEKEEGRRGTQVDIIFTLHSMSPSEQGSEEGSVGSGVDEERTREESMGRMRKKAVPLFQFLLPTPVTFIAYSFDVVSGMKLGRMGSLFRMVMLRLSCATRKCDVFGEA
ncbi:hypothetical protein BLNAU_12765 [Blattamonas nauphoetae]|uniref:Uncharacterized protein n=1 Tax=Blattamonas nauphoetae TaxID=2049346 RepID=A0ABQ9XLJ8_9EUKA|nr:hypothetical protein BLNAU_12765 [Blattamonas nauphoetae]